MKGWADSMRRLALFKSVRNNLKPVAGDEHFEQVEGYLRVSEYVTVEFPPIVTGEHGEAEFDRLEVQVNMERDRKLAELRKLRSSAGMTSRVLAALKAGT